MRSSVGIKERPETNRAEPTRGRIGMLDGLRGLALVAVLFYHAAPSTVRGGFIGVEVFFVLSGYLLTALLLEEGGRNGRIDTRAYAVRRIRRIAPALFLLLLGLLLVAPLLAPADVYRLRGDVLASLAGLTNWRLIADGSSYFTQLGRAPLVRHLWSIAVEIQFYVVCPFLVGWILRRKRFSAIASVAGGIAVSALLMRLMYAPDPSRIYYGTDTRAGGLLAGVLLGVLLGYRLSLPPDPGPGVWLQRFGKFALAALALLIVFADEKGRFMYPGGFLITQVATMLVIAAGLRSGPVASFLDRRSFRWLGERCYGIYLWHWPAVALLRPGIDVDWHPVLSTAASITTALVLGALSYRLIELPWTRRRARRRPRHSPARARRSLVAPAALSLAIAPIAVLAFRLPTTNPIEESLREGQRAIEGQGGPLAAKPLLVLTPVENGPASVAPTPGVPVPIAGRITAIGDSVMVGAAPALQGKLGPPGFIDAIVRRQFGEGIEVVRALKAGGALGEVVIVHLGNNGPVRRTHMDAMMTELAGARNVLLVTVRVGRPWEASVNQTYEEAANRYPQVRVVDWQRLSAGHPEWFHSDGSHLKPGGARAYADAIAGVLATLPPAPPVAQQSTPAEPSTILLGA